MRVPLIVVLAGAALAGCVSSSAPEPSYVKIETAATRYEAGDTVIVTLVNDGTETIWYCRCRSKLQALRDGGWIDAGNAGDPCINAAAGLAAGETVSWKIGGIPKDAQAGMYRYLLRDLWASDGSELPETWRGSTAFLVGSP